MFTIQGCGHFSIDIDTLSYVSTKTKMRRKTQKDLVTKGGTKCTKSGRKIKISY